MREQLASHWWLFLVRGILALALGLTVPFFPVAALITVALLFGAYAFVDGVVALIAAFRMSQAGGRWGWLIVEGIVGILVGAYVFFDPAAAILALSWLLGAWALVTGVMALGSAFSARRHVPNEWLWALGGILSIVFGIFVFFAPALGAWAIIYLISFYAILAGIIFIGLAFRLRGLGHKPPSQTANA
ncbi:MAG: HdeD family acid-resistance protein [Candidatus Velthaea sp.]|jgi:uncharacterized membrane protein HdeD (DUF308 family)